MSNQNLLRSLDFTRAAGERRTQDDVRFNDVSEVGGFPFEQKIQRINKVELFANATNDAQAVIVGLNVTYTVDGSSELIVISHGIVEGVRSVGIVQLQASEILVGANARVKKLPNIPDKNGCISFIQFSIFNKDSGTTVTKGPFGSTQNVGDTWASYGPIIAFQGTETDELGLTSLGYIKLTQGVPGFGILNTN